jgi:phage-related protein
LKVLWYSGVEEIAAVWPIVSDRARRAFAAIGAAVRQGVSAVAPTWNIVAGAAASAWQSVTATVTSVIASVRSAVATGLNAAASLAGQAVAAMGDFFASLPSRIAGHLLTVARVAGSSFLAVWNAAHSAGLGILGAIDPIWPQIVRGMQWVVTTSIGIWKSIISTVAPVVAQIARIA